MSGAASGLNITVTTEDERLFPLSLSPEDTVETVKAIISVEVGAEPKDLALLGEGKELQDTDTLARAGVRSDAVLLVRRRRAASAVSPHATRQASGGALSEAEAARAQLLPMLPRLLAQDPELGAAVQANDLPRLEALLRARQLARAQAEAQREAELAALEADPFDAAAQARIAEHIREQNVQHNLEQALEHHPEAFGRVVMLYVDCEVNARPVKGFVDSGAQSTIMSQACAERCNIMHLIDRRWAGIAKGVGTAKIIGRVHLVPVKIGDQLFGSSFTILEGQDMDFLLGLDWLRKNQAVIDLRANVLRIGEQAVPFLAEKDLPLELRGGGGPDHDSPAEPRKKPAAHPAPAPATAPAPAPAPAVGVPAPPAAKGAPRAPVAAGQVVEATVQQLMSLGFSREQVLQALQACGGNADLAAGILFQGTGGGGFF